MILFLAAVLFWCLLLLAFLQKQKVFWWCMALSCAGAIAVSFYVGFGSVALFSIVSLASAFYYWFHHMCTADTLASDDRKRAHEKARDAVEKKCEVKDASLQRLTEQVNEIFLLFEAAKDFNECLHISDSLHILTSKFLGKLTFHSGLLITLEGKRKKYDVGAITAFSGKEWSVQSDETRFDIPALVKHAVDSGSGMQVMYFDYAALKKCPFICDYDAIHLPLWIFPLVVEESVVGILIIEGGQEDATAKFTIIAGQLALLLKKIALYNTVKDLSITDGLTGVFLRRYFIERFIEEIKRSINNEYSLSVLMLDIDHFKMYNDTFGHLVGDVTLREVSKVIKENVRKVDLIARYGGEEFAIILPETNEQGAFDAAERIRLAVENKHFEVYDEETRVTVSIGIASFVREENDDSEEKYAEMVNSLLHNADHALYEAKEQGRNRVKCFGSDA